MKKVSAFIIIGGLAAVSGLCLTAVNSSAAQPSAAQQACEAKLSSKAQDELKKRRAAYATLTATEKNDVRKQRAENRVLYLKLSLRAQGIVRAESQGKKPKTSDSAAVKEAAAYQASVKASLSQLSDKERTASAPLSAATKQELMAKCGPKKPKGQS